METTESRQMKVGDRVEYTTEAGVTHTIEHFEKGRFSIGFDECSSLSEAKKTLEWVDSSDNDWIA
jgi:plastocyanin